MAFFRNDAVNRVNLHYGVQALAQAGGGIFFLVFMVRAGVPVPAALLAQASIMAGRFLLRPLVLPLAKRWGLKPLVVAGGLVMAIQYPLLGEVRGVGADLVLLVAVAATAELLYWPAYNAYFAAVGDPEHRGHQVSAREALVSLASIVAPLAGAWALLTLGPRWMFAGVALVQALSILPLLGAPNVAIRPAAPGAFRAARIGMMLSLADGWFDAWFLLVWQVALFLSLGESISAYGGAMALAALVGAACGLLLGRHVDAGFGRAAVLIAYAVMTVVLVARAGSGGLPWLAVAAHAAGAFAMTLISPPLGAAQYNLARAAPCPIRFYVAADGAWDVGCFTACLAAAGLAAAGAPLSACLLLALPSLAAQVVLLRRHYRGVAEAAAKPAPSALVAGS